MPETYHVKLSDGREFTVQTEGGAPSESDVLASLNQAPKTPPAQTTAPAQVRSRTGQLYTPPQDSGLKEFGEGIASNITGLPAFAKQVVTDPIGTAKALAFSPVRIASGLLNQPARTLGELTGATAISAIPGLVKAPSEPMMQGVSVADLRKAGVGESAINAMVNGRTPTGGGYTPPPQAPPTPPAAPTIEQAAAAATPSSMPLGQPRVMTLKPTPTSWTPEAARARLEQTDWHSGAESGSPEAANAQFLHRYDAETANRYAHMLQNQNGSISPMLLRSLGIPWELLKYPMAYRYGGWPGVGLMGGADTARLAAKYPGATSNAARAAIMARLAGTQEPDVTK